MLIYHFLCERWGLEDIAKRRIRISRMHDLNDPFEFHSIAGRDQRQRQRIRQFASDVSSSTGLICFSKYRTNPVLWSHYAQRHTGICLGFEVPEDKVLHVEYVRQRANAAQWDIIDGKVEGDAVQAVFSLLRTKYSHWRYESEVRVLYSLTTAIHDGDNFFAPFSDKLRLREVVVGALSTVTRSDVQAALGDLTDVSAFKTRLAFRSFKVVKNRKASMWV